MSEDLYEVALTEEEKDAILSHCGPEPLLVGGQALAFWALWFKVQTPSELRDKVTTDADFIGSGSNASALNKHLNWTIWKPELGDATPQTAKLTKRVEKNGVKQIDFLHSIIGLDTKDIRKRAVSIKFPPSTSISVLHPVDVLTSRLKNLQYLPEKQNDVGVAQARLAMGIVAAFLETLLDSRRELLNWIERVAEIALDSSLGSTLDSYELDPLQCVPATRINVPEFRSKRWPQILELSRNARIARAIRRDERARSKSAK